MRKRFIPTYVFSLLIWFIASLPGEELSNVQRSPKSQFLRIIFSDPFMHFSVFGLLALLICMGFYRESVRAIPVTIVALLSVGYGLLIELYQGILPWRSFGFDDIFWNTLGALFVLALVSLFKREYHSEISHTEQ